MESSSASLIDEGISKLNEAFSLIMKSFNVFAAKDPDSITTGVLGAGETDVENLADLLSKITSIRAKVAKELEASDRIFKDKKAIMTNALVKKPKSTPMNVHSNSYASVTASKTVDTPPTVAIVQSNNIHAVTNNVHTSPNVHAPHNGQFTQVVRPKTVQKISLVAIGEFSIQAITVETMKDAAKIIPNIIPVYVKQTGRFYFCFGGERYEGNVGNIYTSGSKRRQVEPCKYGDECNKDDCDFYHDPVTTGKTNPADIRSFDAKQFQYVDPVKDKLRDTPQYMRFGSRENLSIDFQRITEDEVKLAKEKCMQLLLSTTLFSSKMNEVRRA